ncbi:MAG: hypothetical protein FWG17_03055 [Desulfovibrionaceae bacterium]|nr:hypothetical protein [Desulfovibrionaceae bacterium]
MDLTPFEAALDADTTRVVQDSHGPGLPVTLLTPEGAARPLRGFFEQAGLDVTPGTSHAPVLSTAPLLHIQVSLVQAALDRPLSRRDRFIVRGRIYRVEQPLPDGFGMIACKLLEDEDA